MGKSYLNLKAICWINTFHQAANTVKVQTFSGSVLVTTEVSVDLVISDHFDSFRQNHAILGQETGLVAGPLKVYLES